MNDIPHETTPTSRPDAFDRAADRAETETERRKQERIDARQRTGFRIHATSYVTVQILIFAIWLITSRTGGTSYPWFVYPLVGWGIGLAAHYAAIRDSYRGRGSQSP
jgi:hypothetical protein